MPFDLQFFLDPFSGTITDVSGTPYTRTSAGSGSLDLSNTFVLSGLQLFDDQMNPVARATFTSGSGTQYGPNGVQVVPEPGSFVLLASALLVFGHFRFRPGRNKPVDFLRDPHQDGPKFGQCR